MTTDDQIHNGYRKFVKKESKGGRGNFNGQEMNKWHLQARDKALRNSSLASWLQCMKINLILSHTKGSHSLSVRPSHLQITKSFELMLQNHIQTLRSDKQSKRDFYRAPLS